MRLSLITLLRSSPCAVWWLPALGVLFAALGGVCSTRGWRIRHR